MMYFFRKGKEYFFPKIERELLENALGILSQEEREIFLKMGNYDKFHSLEVFEKLGKTKLKDDILYLKLALLHDCGKGKSGIIARVLHKMGITTKLKNHGEMGYDKVRGIDEKLGILIKNHHTKNYSEEMDIFQKCDDES